jgi:nucleoside-diphosphate-sugar epimerase
VEVGIFGAAGAIGKSVAPELRRRGITVRVVGRNESTLKSIFGDAYEAVSADLVDREDAIRATRGLDAIVYAVGVPYQHFELHPAMMRVTVDAAKRATISKLLLVSNVYSYGLPHSAVVNETHPRDPQTFKGRMRKEQEDIALGAHDGSLQTLVLRLPDFYSADAENSLAMEIFKAARDGRGAPVFAPVDAPHEWMYTPDVGPVICDLLARPDAFGTAYNMSGLGTITTREFATQVFEQFGMSPKFRVVTPSLLRVLGIFNPLMKELVEMNYLQSNPVILDDSKLTATIGPVKKTSYAEGIGQTAADLRELSRVAGM